MFEEFGFRSPSGLISKYCTHLFESDIQKVKAIKIQRIIVLGIFFCYLNNRQKSNPKA